MRETRDAHWAARHEQDQAQLLAALEYADQKAKRAEELERKIAAMPAGKLYTAEQVATLVTRATSQLESEWLSWIDRVLYPRKKYHDATDGETHFAVGNRPPD